MMDMCRLHPQGRSLVRNQSWSFPEKPSRRSTVAALIRPSDGGAARVMRKNLEANLAKPGQIKTGAADYGTCKTAYKDSWLEPIAINHLSKSLQAAAGIRSRKSGYESLLDAARIVWEKFNPNWQREIIIEALRGVIPGFILYMRSRLTRGKTRRRLGKCIWRLQRLKFENAFCISALFSDFDSDRDPFN